jgi:hypothetical protein
VGQTNHGRLRREELEREVVGAIGQRGYLIRDPLHGGIWTGKVGEGEESWRGVIRKCANVKGSGEKVRVGQVDLARDLHSHIVGSCQRTRKLLGISFFGGERIASLRCIERSMHSHLRFELQTLQNVESS